MVAYSEEDAGAAKHVARLLIVCGLWHGANMSWTCAPRLSALCTILRHYLEISQKERFCSRE